MSALLPYLRYSLRNAWFALLVVADTAWERLLAALGWRSLRRAVPGPDTEEIRRFVREVTGLDYACAWLGAGTGGQMGGYAIATRVAKPATTTTTTTKGGENVPERLFIKVVPEAFARRLFVASSGNFQREVHFYTDVVKRLQNPVPDSAMLAIPRCIFAEAQGTRGIVAFEYFDSGMKKFGEPFTLEQCRDFLRGLACIHARFWGVRAEDVLGEKRLRHKLAFTRATSPFFFANAVKNARKRSELLVPGSPRAKLMDLIASHGVDKVLGLIASSGPRTMIHGDTHGGNIFVTKEGRMGLLDWAEYNAGNPFRDVAQFLVCNLHAEELEAHEEELLGVYLASLAEKGGPRIPLPEAREQYIMCTVYNVIIIIYGLGFGFADKGHPMSRGFHPYWRDVGVIVERFNLLSVWEKILAGA